MTRTELKTAIRNAGLSIDLRLSTAKLQAALDQHTAQHTAQMLTLDPAELIQDMPCFELTLDEPFIPSTFEHPATLDYTWLTCGIDPQPTADPQPSLPATAVGSVAVVILWLVTVFVVQHLIRPAFNALVPIVRSLFAAANRQLCRARFATTAMLRANKDTSAKSTQSFQF
jgi:hypothetical protein